MKPLLWQHVTAAGLVGLCSWLLTAGIAQAASSSPAYPTRPIRFVLPFPPGGGTEALARMMTPKLSEAMGQQWVIDNRAGAAGNIATEIVAKAAPDGHTLLMGISTALTVSPVLYKNLPYDVARDLRPITPLTSSQYLLVIHPSVPAASLKEFIALARGKPGTLNYSSSGIGGTLHLAAELFKYRTGVDIAHVAYKGGGPATLAVLSGEVQMVFGSVSASMPHVRTGKLRALAVSGLKRSSVAPEIATLNESGIPGFNVTSWYGLLAPGRTPEGIVNRLHREALAALNFPDVQEGTAKLGLEITTTSPGEFSALIKTETVTWAEVIRKANIKAE